MKKPSLLPVIAMIAISGTPTLAGNSLDYQIQDGAFVTSKGLIPPGCFGQLMTEFNGDNHIAAIYLSRNTLRGCIDANIPYPSDNEIGFTYQINEHLGNHKFKLKVCQYWDEGSLRGTCDNIVVRFMNKPYTSPKGTIQVLTLEKIGEW